MSPQVFDFFSYYKAQAVLLCATILIALLLVGLINGWLHKLHNYIWISLAIYATSIIASTILSEHPSIAFNGFYERYEGMWVLLAYLIIMYAACALVHTTSQIKLFLNIWFTSVSIVCAIGFFQWLGFDFFRTVEGKTLILPSEYQSIASKLEFNFPSGIVYSTLYNPNNVAIMISMALPSVLTCYLFSHSRSNLKVVLAISTLFTLVLIATKARGALIGVAISMFLMFSISRLKCMHTSKLQVSRTFFMILIPVIVLFALFAYTKISKKDTNTDPSFSIPSSSMHADWSEKIIKNYGKLGSGRVYIWTRSLQMADDTVFVGHGPDTFALYFPNSDPLKQTGYVKPEDFIDKPHNFYLQNWLNIGSIGTLALLALVVIHFNNSIRALLKSTSNSDILPYSSGLFAGWCSYLFAAFFTIALCRLPQCFG